jgi:hypothetical protein
MSQYVTITLRLKTRSPHVAESIAQGAAEHLIETFNDDDSLLAVWHRVGPPPVRQSADTEVAATPAAKLHAIRAATYVAVQDAKE